MSSIQGPNSGPYIPTGEFQAAVNGPGQNQQRQTSFTLAEPPPPPNESIKDDPETPPPGRGSSPNDVMTALGSLTADMMQADMYTLMALMQQMAQQQRSSARELRNSEMQAQISTLQDAAQEIRNAAADRLTGAILSGVMQMAAGAIQIGGAAMSFSRTSDALKDFKTSSTTGTPMTDQQLSGALGKANAFSTGADGASKIGTGFGQMLNATMEQQAAGHDADKATKEAGAKAHEAQTQQAGDLMQQMQDILRDIRDKLSAMEQSRIETTRGIARNI